jgi:hypothetical protein
VAADRELFPVRAVLTLTCLPREVSAMANVSQPPPSASASLPLAARLVLFGVAIFFLDVTCVEKKRRKKGVGLGLSHLMWIACDHQVLRYC